MEHFDFGNAPYRYLNSSERLLLQQAVNIAFYHDDEVIIQPDTPIGHLYVVIKGLVKEIAADGEMLTLYHPRDTFEARGLIEGSSRHHFVVAEQALVYTIPKQTVLDLIASNPRFAAYCYASVADKLAHLSQSKNECEFESLFTAKVRDAYRDNTLWLDGSTSYTEAASALKAHKTKSALVRHQGKTGVFTESAFRDIIIAGTSAAQPIAESTAFQLISIDIDDFVFNALVKMTHHRVQRVVIEENGIAVGTLEQIDVLAYLSNHSHLVAQRLDRAQSLDELTAIAAQMTHSIRLLRSNGVKAPQLAQLMQVLNSTLFEKAWRMIAPPELYEQSCLIVMGSEGRGEQILKTDQDNALILSEHADEALAAEAAERFSEALSQMGYPPCQGKIMVNNPEWRKKQSQFKQMLLDWCHNPTPAAVMNLAIFIDAKAVAGRADLLADVKAHLQKFMGRDAGMLMTFARSVEQFDHQGPGFFTQLLRRGNEKTRY